MIPSRTGRAPSRAVRADADGWSAPPVAAVIGSMVLLALATGLAAANVLATVAVPPGIASSPDAAAVLRFYAAGNEALAGMGPEALAASVAEDARIGSPGDPESDYAAFAADLAAVGRGTPGLRFRVDSVIGAGGQAVARVSLGGGAPEVNGVPVAGAPVVTAGTAFVRLDGGRVAETWDGPDLAGLPRRLPPLELPAWAGPTPVALARFTLPPGSALPDLSSPGPHLLLPVDGAIEVLVDGPASLFVEDADGWAGVGPSARPVRLGPGDALLVGSGVHHAVRPVSPAPAVVLGLAILRPMQDGGGSPRPGDADAIVHMYGGAAGTIVGSADGATAEVLAAGVGALGRWSCPGGPPSVLSVTRLVLAAGESIPGHPVRGVELVAIDVAPDALIAVSAVPPPAPRHEDVRPQTASSIRPIDQGFAASDRRADDVRNDGEQPIAVVSFVLATPDAAGCGP